MNLALINWSLVADVIWVKFGLTEDNFEHGHDTGEFKVIKTFLKWLILIDNGDVTDLVVLVQALDSVLNQLGKFYRAFNCI